MRRYACEGMVLPLINLYRDTENGLLFGVCAGIADRFGWNLTTIRVLAIVALILFPGTAIVYVTAGLLLPVKRLTYYGSRESRLWGDRRYSGTRRARR